LDQLAEEDGALNHSRAGAQVYEEIRESQTEALAHAAAPSETSTSAEYEVMMSVGQSSDSYQITSCSAYGVSLSNSNAL
jgi:hypothetical protein